jgi:hypothetical protein
MSIVHGRSGLVWPGRVVFCRLRGDAGARGVSRSRSGPSCSPREGRARRGTPPGSRGEFGKAEEQRGNVMFLLRLGSVRTMRRHRCVCLQLDFGTWMGMHARRAHRRTNEQLNPLTTRRNIPTVSFNHSYSPTRHDLHEEPIPTVTVARPIRVRPVT